MKKSNLDIVYDMRMALIMSQVVLQEQVREYEAQNFQFLASLTNNRLKEITQALEEGRELSLELMKKN